MENVFETLGNIFRPLPEFKRINGGYCTDQKRHYLEIDIQEGIMWVYFDFEQTNYEFNPGDYDNEPEETFEYKVEITEVLINDEPLTDYDKEEILTEINHYISMNKCEFVEE